MTEQNLNNTTPENPEESSFNLYEIIFKYLVYWPWFVASVIICLVLAFVYLRYQAPVYNVTASVLIKEQDARSRAMSANSGALEALQSMGGFSMTNNFDNEVEILKSRTLIKKVVTQSAFSAMPSRSTRPHPSESTCRRRRQTSWRPA